MCVLAHWKLDDASNEATEDGRCLCSGVRSNNCRLIVLNRITGGSIRTNVPFARVIAFGNHADVYVEDHETRVIRQHICWNEDVERSVCCCTRNRGLNLRFFRRAAEPLSVIHLPGNYVGETPRGLRISHQPSLPGFGLNAPELL